MTMLTRCPHCDTVFRVTAQQLQKQHGQVRCGRCMQIFDGFHTLSSDTDRSVADPGAERAQPAPGAASRVPPVPPPVQPSAVSAAAPEVPESPALAETPAEATDEPTAEIEDEEVDEAPPRRSIAWAAAGVLLAVVLIAQAAFVYRVELAAHYPALKPALVQACNVMGCAVPLPQAPRLISIEASDLHIPDALQPGVIQLTATFRSHAPYEVGYPALDLVLTNAQDHTLARRIFLPAEYLSKMRDPRAGIPPNAEVTVQLDLDTGDLGAAGFRLDLLAAPS